AAELERELEDLLRPAWLLRHWRALVVAAVVVALCTSVAWLGYELYDGPRQEAKRRKGQGDGAASVEEKIARYGEAERKYAELLEPRIVLGRARLQSELEDLQRAKADAEASRWKEEAKRMEDEATEERLHDGVRAAIPKYLALEKHHHDRLTAPKLEPSMRVKVEVARAEALTSAAELLIENRAYKEAEQKLDEAKRQLDGRNEPEAKLQLAEVFHVRGMGHANQNQFKDALD